MTFTYTGARDTDRERVRFAIRDTVSGSGPLPAAANFTDEELDALLADAVSWPMAVADAFDALAAAWATHPSVNADGMNLSRSDICRAFQEQAKRWRQRAQYRHGLTTLTRTDAYTGTVSEYSS